MRNSLAWTCRLMSGQVFVKFSAVPIWHKHRNERTGESLDVQIKGEPSERHATHHTAAAADPERREALISPDSTRWNTVAQSGSERTTYMCACVLAKHQHRPHEQQRQRPYFFEFVAEFQEEKRDWWGPVMGRKEGCWKKEGRWTTTKKGLIWNRSSFRQLFSATKAKDARYLGSEVLVFLRVVVHPK